MEFIYLILPIAGAFILLFVVCCCGPKVKQLFHIPKEVVTGGYRIASRHDDSELPPPPVAFEMEEELPTVTQPVFSDEITELDSGITLQRPIRGARSFSERDSGVYSAYESSVTGVSHQGTPYSGRSKSRNWSGDSQRLDDSGSCIVSIRSRTCSGDTTTNTTNPGIPEYETEDAGVCIIHKPSVVTETMISEEIGKDRNESSAEIRVS